VWGVALSALFAFAGHEVWAHARQGQAAQQTQTGANQSQTSTPGRGGQRGASFPGDRPGGPPSNPSPVSVGWDWWNDVDVKKEVGLRAEQATRIDRIYSGRVKDADPYAQEYQKEYAALNKMFADRVVDDATLGLQLTKVYTLRSKLSESRQLMLYHIAKVLDPDQYAKLLAIFDRRVKEFEAHGRGRTGGEPPHGLR
jgi:hypothetical protein